MVLKMGYTARHGMSVVEGRGRRWSKRALIRSVISSHASHAEPAASGLPRLLAFNTLRVFHGCQAMKAVENVSDLTQIVGGIFFNLGAHGGRTGTPPAMPFSIFLVSLSAWNQKSRLPAHLTFIGFQ